MTQVMLTGSSGFVGGHIAKVLLDSGYKVHALVRPGRAPLIKHPKLTTVEGDLRDRQALDRAMKGCDAVVHTAAVYTFWSPDPGMVYDVNVGGTRNVLQAAVDAGIERVVYTSTVATMKPYRGRLVTEVDAAAPGDLMGDYKRSKWEAERIALRMASTGAPVVVVNPTAPIGTADVRPTPTGKVILDFLKGQLPAVVDTGLNFVSVRDVAEGHMLALERGRLGERYLLGNKHGNLTLREMLGKLSEIAGLKAPRWKLPHLPVLTWARMDTFVEGRLLGREPRVPVEAVQISLKKMWIDPSKAIGELGLPQRPVEDALQEAVDWFRANRYLTKRLRRPLPSPHPISNTEDG